MKAIHFLLKLLPTFLLISGAGFVPLVDSDVQAASQAEVDAKFADNTRTYHTTNADENKIVSLIKEIKLSYEVSDVSIFQSILSPNFQFVYIQSDTDALVDSRESFLKPRRKWKVLSGNTNRELIYSIQSITPDVTATLITVWAFSTYKSKYFGPRFLETMVFEKPSERWMLKRQVLLPLHPNRPELYDVQIFVVRPCEVSERKFQKLAITHGVDAFVDQCLKGSYDSLPYEAGALILFVFREPPPVGSEIKIELIYERTYGDYPFDFTYKVKKRDPYFVIANEVYSEDLDGWFIMRVYVDGIKVGERKIGA